MNRVLGQNTKNKTLESTIGTRNSNVDGQHFNRVWLSVVAFVCTFGLKTGRIPWY